MSFESLAAFAAILKHLYLAQVSRRRNALSLQDARGRRIIHLAQYTNMNPHKSAISHFILIVGLLVLFFTNGCAKAPNKKLVIAEGTQPIAAPIYVAAAEGFFREQGLDVDLAAFPTGKLCLDALLGGKADFATVAETPIMHAMFKNQPIRIVATIHRSRRNTFCIARIDRGIKSPKDLRGKTIAVPFGTNAEFGLAAFLAKYGILPTELKFINLTPPEMPGTLTRGDVDAVVAWQPHAGRCEKALGQNAISFSFAEVYEETYNLVTSTQTAQEKSEIVMKLLTAVDRATSYIATNRDGAINIVAGRIGMDQKELGQLWPIYNFGLDLRESSVKLLTEEGKWAVERGHQSGTVPDMATVLSGTALRSVKPKSVDLPQVR